MTSRKTDARRSTRRRRKATGAKKPRTKAQIAAQFKKGNNANPTGRNAMSVMREAWGLKLVDVLGTPAQDMLAKELLTATKRSDTVADVVMRTLVECAAEGSPWAQGILHDRLLEKPPTELKVGGDGTPIDLSHLTDEQLAAIQEALKE